MSQALLVNTVAELIKKYQQRIKNIDANRRNYTAWQLTETRIEKEVLKKTIADLELTIEKLLK